MSSDKQEPKKVAVRDLELERGVILGTDDTEILDTAVTEDDFQVLMETLGYAGVNHEDRMHWLEQNGYEPTRENIRDFALPSKPQE